MATHLIGNVMHNNFDGLILLYNRGIPSDIYLYVYKVTENMYAVFMIITCVLHCTIASVVSAVRLMPSPSFSRY